MRQLYKAYGKDEQQGHAHRLSGVEAG